LLGGKVLLLSKQLLLAGWLLAEPGAGTLHSLFVLRLRVRVGVVVGGCGCGFNST
jgi:hypothetical protein